MKTPPSFLFVCAGGHRTGLGHLKRSRVLCSTAKELGYRASLRLLADDPVASPTLLAGERSLLNAEDLREYSNTDDWRKLIIIIDAPDLDDNLLIQLRTLAHTLVLASPVFRSSLTSIIDLAVTRAPVRGLTANTRQEYGIEYSVFAPTKYQLDESSFEYMLKSTPPRVGVCFGGSDPDNLTWEVLRYLRTHPIPLHISVVVGPSFRYQSTLDGELDDVRHRIELIQGKDDPWADLGRCRAVLLGGGLMALEAAALGLPAVHLARNSEQRELLRPLESAKAVVVGPLLGTEGTFEAARLLLELVATVPELRLMRGACRALNLEHGAARWIRTVAAIIDPSPHSAMIMS